MRFPLIGASSNNYGTAATYAYFGGSAANVSWSTTESQRQIPLSEACTLTDFRIILDTAPGTGATRTFTVRKNGVATAATVTISGAATAALFSGSVSFAEGDLVSIQATSTGSPAAPGNTYWYSFVETVGNLGFIMGGATVAPGTASTGFTCPFGSALSFGAASGGFDIPMPTDGTLRKAWVASDVAPGTAKSYALSCRVNNTTDALTATVSGAATTASASGTQALVAGDNIEVKVVPSGVPATAHLAWCFTFQPTVAGESVRGHAASNATLSTTTTQYNQPLGAGAGWGNTESGRLLKPPGMSIQKLRVRLDTAPGTAASRTFTWRDNATSSSLAVTISGTNTTGNDASDSAAHTPDDSASMQAALTGAPLPAVAHISYVTVVLTGSSGQLADGGGDSSLVGQSAFTIPIYGDGGGDEVVAGTATHQSPGIVDAGGGAQTVAVSRAVSAALGPSDGGGALLVVGTTSHSTPLAGDGGGALLNQGARAEINDQPGAGGGGGLTAVAVHVTTLRTDLDGGGDEAAVTARRAVSAQAVDGGGDPINSASSNRGSGLDSSDGGGVPLAVGAASHTEPSGSYDGGGANSVFGQRSLVGAAGFDGGGVPLAAGFVTYSPTIGPSAGGGELSLTGVRHSGCDALSQVRIAPDAITGISNLSGDIFDINDDPDSDDGDWLIAPDPLTNTFVETSFFTPPPPTHGPQRIRVRVRTTFLAPEITADIPLLPPTVRLDAVDSGGSFIATSGEISVPTNYPHGGVVFVDFDASSFVVPDGSMIQIRVFGTAAVFHEIGWTVEVGGIAWLVGQGCSGMSVNGGGDNRSAGMKQACFAYVDTYSDIYTDTYGTTFSPCGPSVVDVGGAPLAVARKQSAAIQLWAGGGSNEAQPQIRRQVVTVTIDGGGTDTVNGQRTTTIGPLGGGGAATAVLLKVGRTASVFPGGGQAQLAGVAVRELPCTIMGVVDAYTLSAAVDSPLATGVVEDYALTGVVGRCGHTGDCDCG